MEEKGPSTYKHTSALQCNAFQFLTQEHLPATEKLLNGPHQVHIKAFTPKSGPVGPGLDGCHG